MGARKKKYEKPRIHDFVIDIGEGGTGTCSRGLKAASCGKGNSAGSGLPSNCTNGTGANGNCGTGASFGVS